MALLDSRGRDEDLGQPPTRVRHPTERSREGVLVAFTVFQRVVAGEPSTHARGIQQSALERAFSGVYSLPEGGGRGAPPRGIQHTALDRAFSGVYSLPEGGGRGAPRAASNRPL